MANPVGFEGANTVRTAPPGLDNCRDLELFSDGKQCISAWRLTPEELEEVKRTGVIWLNVIWGNTLPPVIISGTPLIQLATGKPPRVEPYIPPARKGSELNKKG